MLPAEPAYLHDLPVLVVSMHDEMLYAERTLRAGARGYVMKEAGGEKLLEAVRSVGEGRVFVSDKVSSELLGNLGRRTSANPRRWATVRASAGSRRGTSAATNAGGCMSSWTNSGTTSRSATKFTRLIHRTVISRRAISDVIGCA